MRGRIVSARVAQPNTPITDLTEEVPHVVSAVVDGKPVEMVVVAKDPLDAIKVARVGGLAP